MASGIIAVELSGGVGNQLFQYAAGLALARRHDAQLVLDTSQFRRRDEPRRMALAPFAPEAALDAAALLFSRDRDGTFVTVEGPPLGREAVRLSVIRETTFDYEPMFEDLGPDVFLRGYWQSYRYLENELPTLRKAADAVAAGLDPRNRALLNEIRSQPSVSVHVRHGDYLREPYQSWLGVCRVDYYRGNMDRLRAEMPGCRFYVFSDDAAWCRSALADQDAIVVAHNGPGQAHIDLVLMAACRRHILSNSSLGWWAAYLGERPQKPPIAPVPWFRGRVATPDLCPPGWELRSRATNDPLDVVNERVARTRVSVVIPARNSPAMLEEAVASVMRQTKPASEIIVVLSDAGAECATLARELAGRDRLKVMTLPDANPAKAKNAGFRAATGDWIAFLDDDDTWLPTKLEQQLTVALLLDVGVATCDFILLDNSGHLVRSGLNRVPAGLSLAEGVLLGSQFFGGSAAIFRADLLRRVDGFDERLPACEDFDLWLRIVRKNEMAALAEGLVHTRRHQGRTSRNEALMRAGHRALFAKLRAEVPRELRHMLFPVGLLQWVHGRGVTAGDVIRTLPQFLASPASCLKLTRHLRRTLARPAAVAMVRKILGRPR